MSVSVVFVVPVAASLDKGSHAQPDACGGVCQVAGSIPSPRSQRPCLISLNAETMLDAFMIEEEWLQSVVSSLLRLPALSPSTSRAALQQIDLQVRLLVQQAQKFQKHSRSPILKG